MEIHAFVEVDELGPALEFYTRGLGLRALRQFTDHWVELAGANVPVHLLARPEGRDFSRHWTPVHLDFVVDDLEAALARALAAGGTLDREIVDHHYWRFANLADPSGNGVDLIALAPGGYDRFVAERPHRG